MFGLKRRRIQRSLPTFAAKHEHDLGCALLDAFRTMDAGQQVCLHCHARGGFEMNHHPNCIVGKAAARLFALGVHDPVKRRYLTFEEHQGEVRLLRARLQQLCAHTGWEHRPGSWWCPECYASGLTAISDSTK